MQKVKTTNYRWGVVGMLFMALTINYMDRQVLSLTWKDFIAPEFHWTNNDYGTITGLFSIFYAIGMLFAGRFMDWMGTKKGFMWAIGIWSLGACLHAFCGLATAAIVTGVWPESFRGAVEALSVVKNTTLIASVSVYLFVIARFVLAIGEAGNFPASIKAVAEYFPKKDRGFATSIFNSGAAIGPLIAPLTIPFLAKAYGWEMAFIIIGATGFIWMAFWVFLYKKPEENKWVNAAELTYIQQDEKEFEELKAASTLERKVTYRQAFRHKQTWAFAAGKFMSDGAWWFFLFWTPAYLSSVYGLDSTQSAPQIFVMYAISMLSLVGGWLPTYYVDKKRMNPYEGRMKSMLIFAFIPLIVLFAQPLGYISVWIPVIIIGVALAAHQSWSANLFSTIGDMFPKHAIGTITGIGGLAGGIASFIMNKGSGVLFDYAESSSLSLLGFKGIESGYFIVFCLCAVTYLIGWSIMKALVPKYKIITEL